MHWRASERPSAIRTTKTGNYLMRSQNPRAVRRLACLLWLMASTLGCNTDTNVEQMPKAPPLAPKSSRRPNYLQQSPGWPGPAVIDPGIPLSSVPGGDLIHTDYAGVIKTPKPQGRVAFDAETKQIMWRAMTCNAPDCPGEGKNGEPFLFFFFDPTLRIEGESFFRPDDVKGPPKLPICPACRRSRSVVEYFVPEVAQRRDELFAELQSVRQAREEAERSGKAHPVGLRSPNDISAELGELPAVYLLRKP